MALKKKEEEIEGWKSIEITELNEDDMQKVSINDLGWWLATNSILNIWWKDGYYAYYHSGAESGTEIKEKTIFTRCFVNTILYLKGEHHKYLEIDNETLETGFIDKPKLNTTEKTYVAVFNFNSDYMNMILEAIKNKEEKQ